MSWREREAAWAFGHVAASPGSGTAHASPTPPASAFFAHLPAPCQSREGSNNKKTMLTDTLNHHHHHHDRQQA